MAEIIKVDFRKKEKSDNCLIQAWESFQAKKKQDERRKVKLSRDQYLVSAIVVYALAWKSGNYSICDRFLERFDLEL